MSRKKDASIPNCKFNEGVGCASQSRCDSCGFNPLVQERREIKIEAAAARGDLTKGRQLKKIEHVRRSTIVAICDDVYEKTVRAGNDMKAAEVKQLLLKIGKAVRSAPAAPVAQVVRCGECVYSAAAKENEKGFIICPVSGMEISDNDFCSYGERRR